MSLGPQVFFSSCFISFILIVFLDTIAVHQYPERRTTIQGTKKGPRYDVSWAIGIFSSFSFHLVFILLTVFYYTTKKGSTIAI
jgi:hypothetical protein